MKAAAKLAAQIGLIALCLTPVVRQLVQDWGAISLLAAQLHLPALLASCALLVLSSLFLPVALSAFTYGGQERIDYRDSALAYFASQPMKYLPGGFWILPARVVLLGRLGHDAGLASGGLLFEMVSQALSAALVAALLLGAAGMAAVGWASGVWLALAGSLLSAGLLLASPGLVRRIRRVPQMVRSATAPLAAIPVAARARNLAITVAAFALMWLVMGASFYLLMVATNPRLDLALLKIAVGVSTLSWLVGFLAPFSPGGIGVREGAIVLLLNALAPGPEIALVALLSRLLALLVELAFAAGAWLARRGAPSGRAFQPRRTAASAFLPLKPLPAAVVAGGGPSAMLQRISNWKQPVLKATRFLVVGAVAATVSGTSVSSSGTVSPAAVAEPPRRLSAVLSRLPDSPPTLNGVTQPEPAATGRAGQALRLPRRTRISLICPGGGAPSQQVDATSTTRMRSVLRAIVVHHRLICPLSSPASASASRWARK